jgi:Mg-chelatase subunit ChlD
MSLLSRVGSGRMSTPATESTNNGNDAIIESITCPITGMPMTDPVQGPDGHTYERSAITEWLNRNPTSPQTREPMQVSQLKVNASIRFLCDKYHRGEFGQATTSRPAPKISSEHIKINHTQHTDSSKKNLMISFNIDNDTFPKQVEHLSQDIVLCIDRSGSMQTSVEAKDADGNQLEAGFSVQDIVNHAAKTVAKTLNSTSRLAIIVFDNEIEILFDLKPMTEMNQSQAIAKIASIQPRGQTNIYGAIEKAIEILDTRDDKSNNGAIIMLTDGIPNISPARGEVETLKKLRIKKNFTAPIYTFGFGYNLQRGLLYDIAKCANGANGHIPDGGMIATVFCNFIGTILTTVAMNLQLHVYTPGVTLMGDYISNYNSELETTIYDLGTVQYQQSRDIVFNLGHAQQVKYCFSYKIGGASYQSETFDITPSTLDISSKFNTEYLRYKLVENIRTLINYASCGDHTAAGNLIDQFEQTLKSAQSNPNIIGMINNLSDDGTGQGQIKMASTNQTYFRRWGEYYLDQLSRSLNQQIKPNFKDTACLFGGSIFNNIVDKASDIFDSLPPPTPSNISRSQYGSSYRSLGSTPAPVVNMSVFNDPNGGCFTGDAIILLANGDKKLVKDLVKGDRVMTLKDPYGLKHGLSSANVVCILKTITTGKINLVTTPKGLKITPWHPIIAHGIWTHPSNIFESNIESCDAIYTIMLDNYHTFNLNGYWVIGIGHNYKIGILAHEYFGTNDIITDLMNMPSWDTGIVTIHTSQYTRDYTTNNIIGIRSNNYTIKNNAVNPYTPVNMTNRKVVVI